MRFLSLIIALGSLARALSAQDPGRFPLTRDSIVGRLADLQRIHTPEGVEEVEQVEVNGSKQWISIRGLNRANPVLLLLHGGPGSAMLGMTWAYQKPWEDFFTVVNWDQRGVGKNFDPADTARLAPSMTVSQHVNDAEVIVRHVLRKLGHQKLVLMGYSFGTVIGPLLVQRRPELFHAWVGVGVVAGQGDNETVLYQRVLQLARQRRDTAALRQLEAMAPYPGPTFDIRKALAVREWVRRYDGGWYGKPDFNLYYALPEFGPAYSATEAAGVNPAMSWAGPLLTRPEDLPRSTRFDVPVIYLMGRYDLHTPFATARAHFDQVVAPRKTFIPFERASHMIMFEEPGRFLMTLVNEVLPLAGGGRSFVVMPDPPARNR